MKKCILFLTMLLMIATISFAQCNKKFLMTGSKTFFLDTSGKVEQTMDQKSVIHVGPSEIIIHVNDDPDMKLTIKSTTCNWVVPYKTGKTFMKATGNREDGEVVNATMEIEGKDGKISLIFKMENRPQIIKVEPEKFEEEK